MVAGSAPSGPGRAIWRPTPWLIGVVAIGALTRAVLLDQVMRQDEAVTLARFARSFTSAFTDYSAPNNHMLHSALVSPNRVSREDEEKAEDLVKEKT